MSGSGFRTTFVIEAGHPSLPGHFPGNPVVPGVVLLDRVAAVLEAAMGGVIARIGAVKFLAPLRPGETAALHVTHADGRARFHIERDGTPVLRGHAELVAAPPSGRAA